MSPKRPDRRRPTQPQRRFEPSDLAGLGRDERRKLTQLLLTENGSTIVEFHSPVAYDELILETRPLWRARRVRVRIADRAVQAADLQRLADAVAAGGEAEGVLIAPLGVSPRLHPPPTVMLIGPEELIARMERCAVIAWPDRRPTPAFDRLSAQRDLDRDAFLLDPMGLRWLPALALNELPIELTGSAHAPDALFERLAFRLLTTSLRFGGTRYGEAARGQRLPDATLACPGSSRLLALMDCKATADGYTMDSDHYLRFKDYVASLREDLERDGGQLRYLIVLSSAFSGTLRATHPFHARADALRDDTGLTLVYLRAEDLARTATLIESGGLSPTQREALDWSAAFDHGIVDAAHLEAMLEG